MILAALPPILAFKSSRKHLAPSIKQQNAKPDPEQMITMECKQTKLSPTELSYCSHVQKTISQMFVTRGHSVLIYMLLLLLFVKEASFHFNHIDNYDGHAHRPLLQTL